MTVATFSDASEEEANDVSRLLPILEREGITVLSVFSGYVECPGRHLHTSRNADSNCIVYDNGGVPFLHCFHQSCAGALEEANARLSAQARAACPVFVPKPRETARRTATLDTGDAIGARILTGVLEEFPWSYNEIVNDPAGIVAESISDQWPHLIALFPDDAVVWIGRDKFDSGKARHQSRFRTSADWLDRGPCGGAYICPNSFKPGSWSRSNPSIEKRNFLVVESDSLNRDQVGAVFRFLESENVGMRLRAVVDTGGKSLHGWFDYPGESLAKRLRKLLPALGCDRAMFNPSQPTRLPGAFRIEKGRFQRLIYFPTEN